MRAVVVNQASTGVEVVDHEKPAVLVMVKLWLKLSTVAFAILTFM